jgi:DNA-binding MarR family transcriptional regulator
MVPPNHSRAEAIDQSKNCDSMESAGENASRPDLTAGIRLLARLARVAERACRESGISLPQYRLLLSVSGASQRPSELAIQVGVSRPTLTSLVDGLAQAGLVTRVPVPTDRRGIRLEPTEAGQLAIERAEARLTQRMLELVDVESGSSVEEIVSAVGRALDREGRSTGVRRAL